MKLNNRVALITGSGHGIALAFGREAGGQAEVVLGHASATADMERAMTFAAEHFGRLDILVNNANSWRRDQNASSDRHMSAG